MEASFPVVRSAAHMTGMVGGHVRRARRAIYMPMHMPWQFGVQAGMPTTHVHT